MHFGFMDVISLRGDQQHVSDSHLQGGKKNTNRIIMCLNHSPVQKSYSFWLKYMGE